MKECSRCKVDKSIKYFSILSSKTMTVRSICKDCINKDNVYANMMTRCYNKTSSRYKDWGGRGITVCKEWHNKDIFMLWLEDNYTKGLQIDRVDNDKGYGPDNCRFINNSANALNQRAHKNLRLPYRGVSMVKEKRAGNKLVVRYRCKISIGNCKEKSLGYHANPILAAITYDKYVIANNLTHQINGF